MTTTREEALEQGWLLPVPTFFGPLNDKGTTDAFDWARTCPLSEWAVTEMSDPKVTVEDVNYPVPYARPVLYKRLRQPQLGYLGALA